jgi:hypothetical protein
MGGNFAPEYAENGFAKKSFEIHHKTSRGASKSIHRELLVLTERR